MNVFLALGSNVGDSKKYIDTAIELLSEKIENIQRAPLYTSKAVGYTDQPDFYNTAISGETSLAPLDLLDLVKNIEQQVGRIYRFRWGPREIDIDIIFYGNEVYTNHKLEIPHPRMHERDFVLVPLLELDPDFTHPKLNKTIKELLNDIPLDQHVVR